MGLKSWQTPDWVIEAIESDVLKFTIDVAATRENAKCKRFISELENALIIPRWGEGGEVAWCNPPYIHIWPWILKAQEQWERYETKTIMLLPSSTGSNWFHGVIRSSLCDVGFVHGRIAFEHPFDSGKTNPMHDNLIVSVGDFGDFGDVSGGTAWRAAERISLAIQDRKEAAEKFCLSCKMSQAEIAILEDAFDLDLQSVAEYHINRISDQLKQIKESFGK